VAVIIAWSTPFNSWYASKASSILRIKEASARAYLVALS